jgi:hypothetical protein
MSTPDLIASQLATIRQQTQDQVNFVAPLPTTDAPSTSASSGSSSSRIAQRLAASNARIYSQGHVISSSLSSHAQGQSILYPIPIDQTDLSIQPPPYPSSGTPTPIRKQVHSPSHFYYRQGSSSIASTDSSVRRMNESDEEVVGDCVMESEHVRLSTLGCYLNTCEQHLAKGSFLIVFGRGADGGMTNWRTLISVHTFTYT